MRQVKEDYNKKRILIVEDSLIVAMEVRENLKRAGYEITGSAVSGEEAIRMFVETKPDLILMDIMLQGQMNGIEASHEIRKIQDVPIIYTTAYSDEETIRDLKLTEPLAYLKKPYDNKELLITIELALERSAFQKKITASEFKYRSLFENSVDAIFLVDSKGSFVEFNISLQRLTGFENARFSSMSLADIITPPAEFDEIKKLIDATGLIKDREIVLKRSDGITVDCQITASSLYIDGFNDLGYQGIIRDVSELKKSLEQQKNLIRGIIHTIAAAVEARDPYTAGHQERVAIISEMIAKEMALPEETIQHIKMAATIHDLGKIHIPSEILSKPTKLTNTEFELMRTHSQIGYDILKSVDFPFDLAGIVYQHHERCDGTGYPQKIGKKGIYLEARIISVADVVEAMASHRPYRPSQGIAVAVDEIKQGRGSRYDEDVVAAFCSLVDRDAFDDILVK